MVSTSLWRLSSESDGRHWGYSEILELELWWEEEKLRFRDPESGEFLLTPVEERAAREAAEDRAGTIEARVEEERAKRMAAEARAAELEAELRRLRGE